MAMAWLRREYRDNSEFPRVSAVEAVALIGAGHRVDLVAAMVGPGRERRRFARWVR